MKIKISREQKDNILNIFKFIKIKEGYFKEMEVCDVFIPKDKMYIEISMKGGVDTKFNARFVYTEKDGLILSLSSQRFQECENINTFINTMVYLRSDFNKINLILNEL